MFLSMLSGAYAPTVNAMVASARFGVLFPLLDVCCMALVVLYIALKLFFAFLRLLCCCFRLFDHEKPPPICPPAPYLNRRRPCILAPDDFDDGGVGCAGLRKESLSADFIQFQETNPLFFVPSSLFSWLWSRCKCSTATLEAYDLASADECLSWYFGLRSMLVCASVGPFLALCFGLVWLRQVVGFFWVSASAFLVDAIAAVVAVFDSLWKWTCGVCKGPAVTLEAFDLASVDECLSWYFGLRSMLVCASVGPFLALCFGLVWLRQVVGFFWVSASAFLVDAIAAVVAVFDSLWKWTCGVCKGPAVTLEAYDLASADECLSWYFGLRSMLVCASVGPFLALCFGLVWLRQVVGFFWVSASAFLVDAIAAVVAVFDSLWKWTCGVCKGPAVTLEAYDLASAEDVDLYWQKLAVLYCLQTLLVLAMFRDDLVLFLVCCFKMLTSHALATLDATFSWDAVYAIGDVMFLAVGWLLVLAGVLVVQEFVATTWQLFASSCKSSVRPQRRPCLVAAVDRCHKNGRRETALFDMQCSPGESAKTTIGSFYVGTSVPVRAIASATGEDGLRKIPHDIFPRPPPFAKVEENVEDVLETSVPEVVEREVVEQVDVPSLVVHFEEDEDDVSLNCLEYVESFADDDEDSLAYSIGDDDDSLLGLEATDEEMQDDDALLVQLDMGGDATLVDFDNDDNDNDGDLLQEPDNELAQQVDEDSIGDSDGNEDSLEQRRQETRRKKKTKPIRRSARILAQQFAGLGSIQVAGLRRSARLRQQ